MSKIIKMTDYTNDAISCALNELDKMQERFERQTHYPPGSDWPQQEIEGWNRGFRMAIKDIKRTKTRLQLYTLGERVVPLCKGCEGGTIPGFCKNCDNNPNRVKGTGV